MVERWERELETGEFFDKGVTVGGVVDGQPHRSMDESIPLFSELYRQVAHDIKGRIANLLDCEKIELTVSLMEAEPERYAAD